MENYQDSLWKGASATPWGPIILEVKLYIFLRILAGGSYIDMIWYGIQLDSVLHTFKKTLGLFKLAFPAREVLNFDDTAPNFRTEILPGLAKGWEDRSMRRYGHNLMSGGMKGGTILAVDGFVQPILAPTAADLKGHDKQKYWNRKGFWGIVCQAGCDVYGRSRYFDIKWPGAEGDIVCYKDCKLSHIMKLIGDEYHTVNDEAYCSIGGNVFCPYTASQLKAAKQSDQAEFNLMNTFDLVLCSERITVERGFGMLTMKWGVLQKPLRWDLQTNCDVIMTCALLHNLCIDDWVSNTRKSGDYEFQRSIVGEVEELGTNLDNFDNLRIPYPNNSVLERASTSTKKRLLVTKFIGQCGFVRTTFSKKMRKDGI